MVRCFLGFELACAVRRKFKDVLYIDISGGYIGMVGNLQKRKICMVGEFAVGKTSLTQKFVNNVFSDKYLTTVGVKIDTAVIGDTKLVVWDIAGRDSLSPVNASYLVGAEGIILVADGTRSKTVDQLLGLRDIVTQRVGDVPVLVALNKHDDPAWEVTSHQLMTLHDADLEVFNTSAKAGENVELIFTKLASKL